MSKKPAHQRSPQNTEKRYHLDRFALQIAADAPGGGGNLDDVFLTEDEMAAWLRCSKQWLRVRRHSGGGPPFERLGPLMIRYNRRKVLAWLNERSHRSTSEYESRNWRKARRLDEAAR